MKVSASVCLFTFASGVAWLPVIRAAVAPEDIEALNVTAPVEDDPCVDPPEVLDCLDNHEACTFDPDSCCDGLKCIGFGFYKKCIEPPICLEEWFDCSKETNCCEGLVCTMGNNSKFECLKPEIGTRTVELPPGIPADLVAATLAPTPAPTTPKNTETTEIKVPVVKNSGGSSGDPHMRTFDGVRYDCQGEGHFILVKSLITRREVQVKYEHLTSGRAISWGVGVAVQDEGDTPRVQVHYAKFFNAQGNELSGNKCKLQFFVDEQLRDILHGSGDDRVTVVLNGNNVKITYTKSQLELNLGLSSCRMNVAVTVPASNDKIVGLLGNMNGDASDDWMLMDGTVMPFNSGQSRNKAGYDFCTKHYCVRDPEQSLFTYQELGVEFKDYNKCDLPFGNTLDQFLGKTPQWVLDLCGSDVECIMDVTENGAEEATNLRLANLIFAKMCSPSGGECSSAKCCGTAKCVDQGGFAGKICDGDAKHAPLYGNCANLPCEEGLQCTTLNNGMSMCLEERVCQAEWMSCDDRECCNGLACLNNNKGGKNCRKLPSCMKNLDDCSLVGCCGTLRCITLQNGGMQCQDIPGCWNQRGRDCSLAPCCDGLTCITKDERQICERLPACVRLGQSCEWSPCCEDATNPMHCANVVDDTGRHGKQCRYIPGEAHVRVWNDVNGNGIQDEGEPGLQGITLRLYDDRNKVFMPNHAELITNVDGMVEFLEVPKVHPLRVFVVDPPKGSVRTLQNRGEDKSKNSNLRSDGFTDAFRLRGVHRWLDTGIGFMMPLDFSVKVFNDLNNDGIQDEGDKPIKGVKLELVVSVNGTFVGLPDSGNGGTASMVVETNADGIAMFTGVPQSTRMRVRVVKAPAGGIPTRKNIGDRAVDSNLRTDGMSDDFTILASQDPQIGLGYRLPQSVNVFIWNDANSDGIQSEGEQGIAGVQVRLVDDITGRPDVPNLNNGGNAHEILISDATGMVSFLNVPQGRRFRVKVLQAPKGAIATQFGKGTDDVNSDLGTDGFSKAFTLTSSEGSYDLIALGYRLPNPMTVRVWDDTNGNGIMDDGEPGIKGVQLRLVRDVTGRPDLFVPDSQGNVNEVLETDDLGFVNFVGIPQATRLRVKVVNVPTGATVTLLRQGTDRTKDSNINSDGFTDAFSTNVVEDFNRINIGYRMPTTMRVRVWDDANANGVQDDGELGVSDVKLCLVRDVTARDRLVDLGDGSNAHEEILTDSEGLATFTGVPKGVSLRVRVLNRPAGAVATSANRGGDDSRDSDLKGDFTDAFNLAQFTGSTFTSRNIGFLMPRDMDVRVWDDINGNGIQESDEPGIEGVILRLVNDNSQRTPVSDAGNGGNAHTELTTDATGVVRFTKIPKGQAYRVQVLNQPPGASRTLHNQGTDNTANSNLQTLSLTNSFRLCSFGGDVFRSIDIGYRMPNDMEVRVWDDVNGNGIQDVGEPGIQGVQLVLVNDNTNKTRVENIGGGSTAHMELTTNETGYVTFKGVPKSRTLRVQLMNPPLGAVRTDTGKGTDRARDSDLGSDMRSSSFNLDSFRDAGAFGHIAMGFRMPKTVVVRAWNDLNNNGVQNEGEPGIPGVKIRLVRDNTARSDLEDQLNGGNAHEELTTGDDGRVVFTKVPRGVSMRVKVTQGPGGNAKLAKLRQGGNDQLDSNLESLTTGLTNAWQLPATIEDLYDMIDVGYVL